MENDVRMQLPIAGSKLTVVRKGAWTPEEDFLLKRCVEKYGEGHWHLVPARAGIRRCRKSCRLRWLNYLKPSIKRGVFEQDEVDLIIRLHRLLGNRWSLIAGRIPGRTANDIKNYWNSFLGKKVSPTWEGALDNRVTAGSTIVKPKPGAVTKKSYPLRQRSPCHSSPGIRETPRGAPLSVIKPPPQNLSKCGVSLTKIDTSPKRRRDEPAKEEDYLSWLRNLLGDEGGMEGQQQQQREGENIFEFPSNLTEGEELLDPSYWTGGPEGWRQCRWEDIFLDADLPLSMLRPDAGENRAGSTGVDGKHE